MKLVLAAPATTAAVIMGNVTPTWNAVPRGAAGSGVVQNVCAHSVLGGQRAVLKVEQELRKTFITPEVPIAAPGGK
jgi:hypothetical protein